MNLTKYLVASGSSIPYQQSLHTTVGTIQRITLWGSHFDFDALGAGVSVAAGPSPHVCLRADQSWVAVKQKMDGTRQAGQGPSEIHFGGHETS